MISVSSKWVIIGSAPNSDLSCILPLVEEGIPVICADGGLQSAEFAGIKPAFYIGDSDSGKKPEYVDGVILPAEKDYTDFHSAILWAVEHGGKELYLAGCTNGRADHYFANVCLLEMISDLGARGVIIDEQNCIFYHSDGNLIVDRKESHLLWSSRGLEISNKFKYLSIIPLDDKLIGVTLRGMKYPIENAELNRKCPIGVSNEMIAEHGEIHVKNGKCLIIFSKDVK